MSTLAIQNLFEQRLQGWADPKGLAVEFENQAFTPPAGQAYLRFTLLPSQTSSDDLAAEHRIYTGIAQIDIFALSDVGAGGARGLAGELEALFSMKRSSSVGNLIVQATSPLQVRGGRVDRGRHFTPTWFSYRGDIVD